MAGSPEEGVAGHLARKKHVNDQYMVLLPKRRPDVVVHEMVMKPAEYLYGENLDASLGEIGSGVWALSLTSYQAFIAPGGWGAVRRTPWSAWQFNVGEHMRNQLVFGNV